MESMLDKGKSEIGIGFRFRCDVATLRRCECLGRIEVQQCDTIQDQRNEPASSSSSLSLHLPYTAPVELTPDRPETTDSVSPSVLLLLLSLPTDKNDEECRTLFPILFLVARCANPPPSAVE